MARTPKQPSFGDILDRERDDRPPPPPPGPIGKKGFRPRRALSIPAPLIVTLLLGGIILFSAQGSLRSESSLADNTDRLIIPEEQSDCQDSPEDMRRCYPGNPAALRAIIGAGQQGIKGGRLPAVYDIPEDLQPPAETKAP